MKKRILLCVLCVFAGKIFAQKQTFDLITYTTPKAWTKEEKQNVIVYSKVDNKDKTWCQIAVYKSTASKGTIEDDLQNEWNELAVKQFSITDTMQATETQEAEGWKIKAASGKFTFNNQAAVVLLTIFSGYDRCVSIVATTNSQSYLETIESFVGSVDLKKPKAVSKPKNQLSNVPAVQQSTNTHTKPAGGFAFITTNFDDGWTSTAQEDWVQVTRSNIKVLIHYPNKNADAYNSVVLDGLKNAWNILVAPKYSSASNFEFKPITGWQTIEFAEADMVEKATGKTVHVVLFKMNYSNGSGKYLEFITPDKSSFEQEFGAYHQINIRMGKNGEHGELQQICCSSFRPAGKMDKRFFRCYSICKCLYGFRCRHGYACICRKFPNGPG